MITNIRQQTIIDMAAENALREAIKTISINPALKDVTPDEMAGILVASLVRMTQGDDIKTLIELYREN